MDKFQVTTFVQNIYVQKFCDWFKGVRQQWPFKATEWIIWQKKEEIKSWILMVHTPPISSA